MSKDAKIVFTPSGKRGTFPVGTPVLDAARSLGVDVDSDRLKEVDCGRIDWDVVVLSGQVGYGGPPWGEYVVSNDAFSHDSLMRMTITINVVYGR